METQKELSLPSNGNYELKVQIGMICFEYSNAKNSWCLFAIHFCKIFTLELETSGTIESFHHFDASIKMCSIIESLLSRRSRVQIVSEWSRECLLCDYARIGSNGHAVSHSSLFTPSLPLLLLLSLIGHLFNLTLSFLSQQSLSPSFQSISLPSVSLILIVLNWILVCPLFPFVYFYLNNEHLVLLHKKCYLP